MHIIVLIYGNVDYTILATYFENVYLFKKDDDSIPQFVYSRQTSIWR